MPNTHTKEQQIDEAKEFARKVDLERVVSIYNGNPSFRDGTTDEQKVMVLLNSALSTAEQERDEERRQRKSAEQDINSAFNCLAVLGIQRERAGTIGNGIMVYEERMSKQATSYRVAKDEAEARCAELEARLQGAAERGVEYCESNRLVAGWQEELRAAILGEKKE